MDSYLLNVSTTMRAGLPQGGRRILQTTSHQLKRSTLFYYSLADVPVMMSIFPALVFIPKFYTSDMGVPLALAANIILGVRLFDMVSDPLMGYISDRTQTRWGRRRPWLVVATPILMLGIYQLYLPPEGAGTMHMLTWMAVVSVGTTMLLIPYYAWAAELSPDYNERSRITGWRSMAGVVGSLVAQLAPALALLLFGIGGSRAVLAVVGVSMLVLMPICILLTVTRVPDSGAPQPTGMPVWQGLKVMLANGPFKRLVLTFMIGQTALAITTPLYVFFIAFVLRAEEMAIFMLTFFYAANFAAVPFWVWASRHIGKHRAYVASFVIIAFAHPFYMLLGEGDFWWMLPVTLTTGFAAGGFSAALPNSMKADVIDLDTLKSGENRAASFFSVWSFTYKATASLGVWIALTGLAFFGFNADPEAVNGADELFGLRFLFSTLPSVFFLAAAAVVWNYPITEARHAEMRAQLEQRAAGPAAAG